MALWKKYLIDFTVIISLFLFYFLFTDSGKKNFNKFVSYSLSKKARMDVDVISLNFKQYPYVEANLTVEDLYDVYVHGHLSNIFSDRNYDLNYTIKSDSIQNDIVRINGTVDLQGTLKGKRKFLALTGQGEIFDGNATYSLKKVKKEFQDVHVTLDDVNSTKVFKIIKQKAIFHGKADATLHFNHFYKDKRKGTLNYKVTDKNFHRHAIDIDVNVTVHDEQFAFNMDANTSELLLKLKHGQYDETSKRAHAIYDLNVSDMSAFKKELGGEYLGRFDASGEIVHDKILSVSGESKSFGGLLTFDLNNTLVNVDIDKVPFSSILTRMSIPPSVEANTTGVIAYDIKKREMQSRLDLHQTKVLPSELSETLTNKLDYDILNETFTESSLVASLKDKVFSSKIILANDKHHLVLKDTKYDTEKKIIDTHINLQTPAHALEGKLFARLDEYITKDVYLKFDGIAEKFYAVKLDGIFNEELINMDYSLKTNRFPSHLVTIEDNVSIQGHINGPYSNLRIRGKGSALDGKVRFDGIKKSDYLENVKIQVENIHALKLYTLLGYPELPYGKADIQADLVHLSKDTYKGSIEYALRDSHYEGLPLSLTLYAQGNEQKQDFSAQIDLGNADINLSKGVRESKSGIAKAFYIIDVKELATFESLLGAQYTGPFYAMGNISYKDMFQIRGLTKTFGGMIDFLYKDEMLIIDVDRSSLKRILALFTPEQMLDAVSSGHINYDYTKKLLLVDAKLKDATFLHNKFVETIFQKSGVNLLKERFTDSTIQARYGKKILEGNINLKSDTAHFLLNHIKLDNNLKKVNAHFDINMQEQEFTGKIYGSLDDPSINLDMQKLLKYQMNKQLDTYMGEGNRKMMESMPMGGTAKDMATDMGGGFMDIFF